MHAVFSIKLNGIVALVLVAIKTSGSGTNLANLAKVTKATTPSKL